MSVSIHWRPTSDQGKRFTGGTSTSLDVLSSTFGNNIDENDIRTLRGMAKLDSFYGEVADIVEQVGSIQVWGVW